VFKQGTSSASKEPHATAEDMFRMLGGTYSNEVTNEDFSKKNIFNLDIRNFHGFLSNLNLDRFQFLREKFNKIPIYLFYLRNKVELSQVLREKLKRDIDPDILFNELFNEFLRDSLEKVIIDHRSNQVLYMKLSQLDNSVSAVNYNTLSIFKSESNWKVEYLSFFFQHFLYENQEPAQPLYRMARTFHLKIPFFENQIAIQGFGNTITYFLPSLDTPEFYNGLLNENDLLHMVLMSSMTSFLLSYPHLSSALSQSIAAEMFNHFVIKHFRIGTLLF